MVLFSLRRTHILSSIYLQTCLVQSILTARNPFFLGNTTQEAALDGTALLFWRSFVIYVREFFSFDLFSATALYRDCFCRALNAAFVDGLYSTFCLGTHCGFSQKNIHDIWKEVRTRLCITLLIRYLPSVSSTSKDVFTRQGVSGEDHDYILAPSANAPCGSKGDTDKSYHLPWNIYSKRCEPTIPKKKVTWRITCWPSLMVSFFPSIILVYQTKQSGNEDLQIGYARRNLLRIWPLLGKSKHAAPCIMAYYFLFKYRMG